MNKYFYPYEVVKDIKTKAVYFKLLDDLSDAPKNSLACCSCNLFWPDVCNCPSDEQSYKIWAEKKLQELQAHRDWWNTYYESDLGKKETHRRLSGLPYIPEFLNKYRDILRAEMQQ